MIPGVGWLAPPSRTLRWAVAGAFAVVGTFFVRDLTATPAIEWMLQYRPEDFKRWSDFWVFVRQMRSGISPPLAMLEIPLQLLFGSMDFATKYLYRVGFLLAFLVPPVVFSRSRLQLMASTLTSFVFLWAASIVTRQNPQAYDVYFPLAMLTAIACIAGAGRATLPLHVALWAAGAGLASGMIDLLRPFGMFLVPVLLLHAFLVWRGKRRVAFLAFAVPLLLISGGWHVKLLIFQDGQIVWSNHGGSNLFNGWSPQILETDPNALSDMPKSSNAPQDFVGSGEYSVYRLDSEQHTLDSKEAGQIIARYVVAHPSTIVHKTITSVQELFAPQLVVYRRLETAFLPLDYIKSVEPKSPVFPVYRVLVWCSATFALVNLLVLAVQLVRSRSFAIVALPESAILMLIALNVGAVIAGERGEEARFIVSLLPLLCVYAKTWAYNPKIGSTAPQT